MKIVITEVRNARSRSSADNSFDVEVSHPQHGWIPYSVGEGFVSRTIDNRTVLSCIGNNFSPYVAPTQAELDAELAAWTRAVRDNLLKEVDAVAGNSLRWAELTEEKKSEWATYRTNLLDVPQQPNFPNTVNWPTKP
tara:strand:- start:1324 stop:1734 length:411 start_codon:yes stop_codon:yes gene_type:complete